MPLYLSWEDTRRMVDQTVVSYEGRLVYIESTDGVLVCTMVDAETGERFRAKADFHKIGNPKEGRLGYVNVPGGNAHYVVRYASRVYKVGFSMENLMMSRRGQLAPFDRGYFGAMLEGLYLAYIDKYPSFKEAYLGSRDTGKLVAYDRSFAVDAEGKVWYQGHRVGQAINDKEEDITWTKTGLLASFTRLRPKLNWRN